MGRKESNQTKGNRKDEHSNVMSQYMLFFAGPCCAIGRSPIADPGVGSLIPAQPPYLRGLYGHFPPFSDSRKAVVSYK